MAVPCDALGLEVLVTLASDPLSSEPSASWDAPWWAVFARAAEPWARRACALDRRVSVRSLVVILMMSATDSPPVKASRGEEM